MWDKRRWIAKLLGLAIVWRILEWMWGMIIRILKEQ
jgi:hypothetical protein